MFPCMAAMPLMHQCGFSLYFSWVSFVNKVYLVSSVLPRTAVYPGSSESVKNVVCVKIVL